MKIMKLIKAKQNDAFANGHITIACLGDSVTQGCFELIDRDGTLNGIEPVYEQQNSYANLLAKALGYLYPSVSFNVINAGISGDTAQGGLERIERDVLRYKPDLVTVCFGLNDCDGGSEGAPLFAQTLGRIFDRIKTEGIEVIYISPCMMNTSISPTMKSEIERSVGATTMAIQNDGIFDMYIDAAKRICEEKNVPCCDCYGKWKRLAANGVNTTELLSNKINHPSREMHWLFVESLLDTILD